MDYAKDTEALRLKNNVAGGPFVIYFLRFSPKFPTLKKILPKIMDFHFSVHLYV